MSFVEIILFIRQLLSIVHLNLFDVLIFTAFVLYVYEEALLGLLKSATNLIAVVLAFFLGLITYTKLAVLLSGPLSLSKGIADALSFFIATLFFYIVIITITYFFLKTVRLKIPPFANHLGGGLSGAISFVLIWGFLVSLLLSFPIAGIIKSEVRESFSGKAVFTKTQALEVAVKTIFGGAIDETLNFLTVKPNADSTVALNFTTTRVSVDTESERKMLSLLNNERAGRGIGKVSVDEALTKAAREHARDMLKRGYFSHYTPEGDSPFDRLDKYNISYTAAAENLAYAPDVDLAHSGLMKSAGHRRNILDPVFNKIGIGVIDAGIYGKMFVQAFSN